MLTAGGEWPFGGVSFGSNCSGTDPDPYRLVFFFRKLEGPDAQQGDQADQLQLVQDTILVCKVAHSLTRSAVHVDSSGELLSVELGKNSSRVPGLSNSKLGDAVLASLQAASLLNNTPRDSKYGPSSLDNFFRAMLAVMPPFNASAGFEDSAYLESASQRAFTAISAQVAKQYFQSNSTSSYELVPGTLVSKEQRLFIRPIALRLMEGILATLLGISLGLVFIAPRHKSLRDPASIGGLSIVLKSSLALLGLLKGSGSWSKQSLTAALTDTYQSQRTGPEFQVVVSKIHKLDDATSDTATYFGEEAPPEETNPQSMLIPTASVPEKKVPVSSWAPKMTKRFSRISVLVLAAVLIIVVEILHRQS
jgi:hypothetical protein